MTEKLYSGDQRLQYRSEAIRGCQTKNDEHCNWTFAHRLYYNFFLFCLLRNYFFNFFPASLLIWILVLVCWKKTLQFYLTASGYFCDVSLSVITLSIIHCKINLITSACWQTFNLPLSQPPVYIPFYDCFLTAAHHLQFEKWVGYVSRYNTSSECVEEYMEVLSFHKHSSYSKRCFHIN